MPSQIFDSIAVRLALGFAVLFASMVALTFYSTNQVNQINTNLESINKVNSVKQRYAINYRGSVHDRAIAIRDVTMLPTLGQRQVAIEEIEKLAAIYTENEVKMTEMINSGVGATDTERTILAEIDGIQAKTNPLVAQIIELQNSGDDTAAKSVLLEQAAPLFVDWLGAINKFIDFQENLNQSVGQRVDDAVGGFEYLALCMLGIAIAFGASVAFFTARSITKPLSAMQNSLDSMSEGNLEGNPKLEARKDEIGKIAKTVAKLRDTLELKARNDADEQSKRSSAENERLKLESEKQNELSKQTQKAVDALADGLQKLAEGDLTTTLSEPFIDSLDRLRVDFNAATSRLCNAMSEVSTNAQAIAGASQEIQSASSALSKRTEQQAASVEETAAALEEITVTVNEASDRSQDAGKLVLETKNNAESSGSVVSDAVEAMGKIEKSATEIGNIISTIDEIAFQTNLLALNAGVEAARAGEAGKGFAVVAQEVRELAQRSAVAAKEIKDLIDTSNGHVTKGVELVDKTGSTLKEMVEQVNLVAENVSAIADTSKEQASGLNGINVNVAQIDQGTQQNANMVSDTTTSAIRLAQEADALFTLLSRFKINAEVQATTNASSNREAA